MTSRAVLNLLVALIEFYTMSYLSHQSGPPFLPRTRNSSLVKTSLCDFLTVHSFTQDGVCTAVHIEPLIRSSVRKTSERLFAKFFLPSYRCRVPSVVTSSLLLRLPNEGSQGSYHENPIPFFPNLFSEFICERRIMNGLST